MTNEIKRKLFEIAILLGYPIIDFIVLVLSIMQSYWLYWIAGIGKHVAYSQTFVIIFSIALALVTITVMYICGAYKKVSSVLNMEEIKNVIKGISTSYLILMTILFFSQFEPSRYFILISYIFCTIFVVMVRTILYHSIPIFSSIKGLNRRIVIYGAGELGKALFQAIRNSPKIRIEPVGFIDDDEKKIDQVIYENTSSQSSSIRVLGNGKNILAIIKEYGIDEVFIASSTIEKRSLAHLINILRKEKIAVSIVPNLYQLLLYKIKLDNIGNIPIIQEINDLKTYYPSIKRVLDFIITLSIFCLIWPIFLLICLAIKIDSKGPIFFRHNRVGKQGRIFEIVKFRTMVVNTAPYAISPICSDDKRITRVGRFLRKTSLDELPQMFNVLKGQMSLVGPRPEMPFIVEKYNEIQRERLKVLPGITGLWQLSGDRRKAIHERIDYDLYYIHNMSFFLDLAILIETLFFAFRGI